MGVDWILKVGKKEYYMDSPVANFMLLLKAAMSRAAGSNYGEAATVVDTGNTSRSCGSYWYGGGFNWNYTDPAAGNDTYGIFVGSDDTAVDILDYNMNTKITNGVGAGQLSYGAQTMAYGGADPNKWAKIMRSFANNTGNPVTVKEVGLVVPCYAASGSQYYILITRDILPSPVAIADTDTMPVEIYIQTTC